jgi:hypothetical protein
MRIFEVMGYIGRALIPFNKAKSFCSMPGSGEVYQQITRRLPAGIWKCTG